MFKIRPEVQQSFRPSTQLAHGERILEGLRKKGLSAKRDEASGDLVVDDGLGHRTRLAFQPDGSPALLTLPSGNSHRIHCDAERREVSFEDTRGSVLLIGRDQGGRVTKLGHPGLTEHRLSYDHSCRLSEVEFPDESRTRLLYDGLGNLAAIMDRTEAKTVYECSEDGSLSAIRDPLGRKTSLAFDSSGQPVEVRLPDGSTFRLTVATSHARTITLRDGSAVVQEFEGEHLRSITWADGESVHFEADRHGNIKNASSNDVEGCVACDFNERNYRVSEKTSDGMVSYSYDVADRLTCVRGPNGYLVEYDYDPDGNLAAIRTGDTWVCRLQYDWETGIGTAALGREIVEAHEHNIHGQIIRSTTRDRNGALLAESEYEYDQCQRVTRIADTLNWRFMRRASWNLFHDREGRLLMVKDESSGTVVEEYDYDTKGNLVYDTGTRVVFGAMDEPIFRGEDGISYDANGSMREFPGLGGLFRCEFSARGFLKKAVMDDQVVHFEYDALGRRNAKSSGAERWHFVWAGCQLIAEELHEDDRLVTRREYIYVPDSTSPIAFREGGRTYSLQSDLRGAIVRAVDDHGRLVWSATYDSFGRATIHIEEVRQPWRLLGQYEDHETGLHYNFARYYCPWLRSYLSLDPQWLEYGASNYSYCLNDPWNRVDPLGTFAIVPILIGAAVGAAIAGGIAWYYHASGWDIAAAMLGGAVGGAIFAAGAGVVLASGAAGVPLYLGLAKWGFVSGIAGSLTTELVDSTDGVCIPCVVASGVVSAVLAPALFGLSRWFGATKFGQWLSGKLRLNTRVDPQQPVRGPNAPLSKFEEYIFKEGATHGKDEVFRALGYSKEHSALLARMWEEQAAAQYARGQYTLGKLDQYGQRINIEIELPGIGNATGNTSYIRSGWMIQPDGSITLNTPFAGFTR